MKSRFKGSVIIMKYSYGLMFRLGSKEYDHEKYTNLIIYNCIRSLLKVNDSSWEWTMICEKYTIIRLKHMIFHLKVCFDENSIFQTEKLKRYDHQAVNDRDRKRVNKTIVRA